MGYWCPSKNYIIANKQILSGLAILMVILTHTGINIFYPGFMGVDVFMFMSGYFLCTSYLKYSLSTFYTRRYKRILAIWLLLAIVSTLIEILERGTELGIVDVICNLTTLSYYGLGGVFVDWYLSSLFLFYILFPVFYKLMASRWNIVILISMLMGVFALFAIVDLHWRFECAIARIPIFCMGIMAYTEGHNNCRKSMIFAGSSCLLLIPAVFLYMHKMVATYYLFYLVAPISLYMIGYILYKLPMHKVLVSFLNFFGKYSLEIYVANITALGTYYYFGLGRITGTLLLTILFGTICICYNACATTLIEGKKCYRKI